MARAHRQWTGGGAWRGLMSQVEIIVGRGWKEDVRYLSALDPLRPAESAMSLLEICDIIDIVVDGTNLTASIPEEAIFGVVGGLLEGLVALSQGTRTKVILEFPHEPWELVLVARERKLFVSAYSLGREKQVVARDLPIDAAAFVGALTEAAEELLRELFSISERFSSDRYVRQLSQWLGVLKRGRQLSYGAAVPIEREPLADRASATSSTEGLTLGYELVSDDAGLRGYHGEQVFDLHALLFAGTLRAELGDAAVELSPRYPFLGMGSLLDRARQLLSHLEARSEGTLELIEPLPHLDFKVRDEGSRWEVEVSGERWSVSPTECLDRMLTLAELFVQDLLELNPRLELNQRFVDLDEEVQNLRRWHRDLCGNDLYHDAPEAYLRAQGHMQPEEPEAAPAPGFAWPLSEVHTLFPRARWEYRRAGLDLSTARLVGSGLLVSTPISTVMLDARSGQERWIWSEARSPVEARWRARAAGPWVVVAEGQGRVRWLEVASGAPAGSVALGTGFGALHEVAYYPAERLLVVASDQGKMAGVDLDREVVRWRFAVGPARFSALIFDGPLICARTTEGQLIALSPGQGQVLWRVRIGGHSENGVMVHQGRYYAVTHDAHHRGSTVHACYPFTGRSVWQVRLAGWVCGSPSFIDQWMVVPVERHGQVSLCGIALEAVQPQVSWRIDLLSAGLYEPTPALPIEIEGQWHGIVRTDRGETTCFRVVDGEVRWQAMPAREKLLLYGNLELFTIGDALLSVGEEVSVRALHSGRRLHTFEAMESPEQALLSAPFQLILGEQATEHGEDDVLAAWSVDHFMAVLEGGGG
ncbi:PQQ-binding-like beta-propeller repeat protein [Lujinxingia vulgaris]|uniref:PQQ-binding-like beta-propeller repeat protein n=2 Tax=Lujinxingia vulgaris TaxID=2600176 RepID=A0A5C6XF83_9DELT|nr:PQQ-binding-like beta-propeller repeat protein [Lujinxingia vulgaris]